MYVVDKEQEERDIQAKYDELISLCKKRTLFRTKKKELFIVRFQ